MAARVRALEELGGPEQARDRAARVGDAAAGRSRAGESGRAGGVGAILGLQRSAGNAAVAGLLSGEAPDLVRSALSEPGRPLDAGVRATGEAALGVDLSSVRVHEGGEAARSAEAVAARAFTAGDHVVLGAAASAAGRAGRERVLAHELAHVVQQRSGPVEAVPAGGGLGLSRPGDRFEQEAERFAAGLGREGRGEKEGAEG